ncbi:hypothetical protein OSCT_0919 [Oscillochloris trichoides DG-6]|uniref:Uncharacterized protein n=1 Tax=Oscillochloris trichoides DG-6 TaxID=765420 RepID=E1IC68_9CHLR|nr:hypothetical protein [Oscillochloris trichoides]EFO81185.1 hypothetical protein OSCT_0919 [Oscillochloris trichoides DG-6]
MSQATNLPPHLDQRIVQERAQIYAAGYVNTLQSDTHGALIQVELPPLGTMSYRLEFRCSLHYPTNAPEYTIVENGIDSYGELRQGTLIMILPQINRWNEEIRLLDLILEAQKRLEQGEFFRPPSSTPAPIPQPQAVVSPDLPPLPVTKQRPPITKNRPATSPIMPNREIILIAGALIMVVILVVAIVGLLWNRPQQQTAATPNATQTAAAIVQQTQTLLDRWAAISGMPVAEQITALQDLQIEGITHDPQGTPVAQRLFTARLARATDLSDPNNPSPDYRQVLALVAQLQQAATDDTTRQQVYRLHASILIAKARAELTEKKVIAAENTLSAWVEANNAQLDEQQRADLTALQSEIATAKQNLSLPEQIAGVWQSYDAAVQEQDWERAVRLLDDLQGLLAGQDPATFQPPDYDPRTPQVVAIQAEARLNYVQALWAEGELDAAKAQLDAAQGVPNVAQRVTTMLNQQTQIEYLWAQVDAQRNARQWQALLTTLNALEPRVGTADGRHPSRDESIAQIRNEATRALAQLEAANRPPTARPVVKPPTITPTDTPEPPTPTYWEWPTDTPEPYWPTDTAPPDWPTVPDVPTTTDPNEPPTTPDPNAPPPSADPNTPPPNQTPPPDPYWPEEPTYPPDVSPTPSP